MRISKQVSYFLIAFGAILLSSGGYLSLRPHRHRHMYYSNSTFYQQNSNYAINQNYAFQHHGFGMFRIISIALVVIGIVLIAAGLLALRSNRKSGSLY